MLAFAMASAQRVWVSTTAWIGFVTPYMIRHSTVDWLPVPAPSAISARRPQAKRAAAGRVPTVGHFSMHSPLVAPLLSDALDVVLDRSAASILLMGKNSDRFLATFLASRPHAAGRIRATGPLSPDALPDALASCDVMMQPYPDGITARRTSALAALAAGVPMVTNRGSLSESLWTDAGGVTTVPEPDGRALGEATLRLLSHADLLVTLSAEALGFYARSFEAKRAAALLAGSVPGGEPHA
jgi:glycosyltransferase involved in cell wall biosynthesis